MCFSFPHTVIFKNKKKEVVFENTATYFALQSTNNWGIYRTADMKIRE